jgi:uncharacterized protein YgiM (DUF1202 family)
MSFSKDRLGPLLVLLLSGSLLIACQMVSLISGQAARATPTRGLPRVQPPASPTQSTAVQPVLPTPLPPPTNAPSEVTATVTENLRVRGGPSTDYQVVDRLTKGATVRLVGRTEASDWWQIPLPSNPDARGWISAEFTDVNGSTDSLPVVEAGPPPEPAGPPAPPPPVEPPYP